MAMSCWLPCIFHRSSNGQTRCISVQEARLAEAAEAGGGADEEDLMEGDEVDEVAQDEELGDAEGAFSGGRFSSYSSSSANGTVLERSCRPAGF